MENKITIHEMNVSDPWFTFLYQGIKKVEGRKMSKTWMRINVGDEIMIYNDNDNRYFIAKVVNIKYYPPKQNLYLNPLDMYLLDVGIQNALPGVKSLKEARNIYLQWSTEKEIEDMGFMGIFIEVE